MDPLQNTPFVLTPDLGETLLTPKIIKVSQYPASLDPNRPITVGRVFKYILYYTIGLPITLLLLIRKVICLGIWFIVDKIVGGLVKRVILPALEKHEPLSPDQIQEKQQNLAENQCSNVLLETPDGIKLDAALVWNQPSDFEAWQQNIPTMNQFKNKKWIIFFNGNGMCYEYHLQNALEKSKKCSANILMFNYRGVMESQGSPTCAKDLILDGHTTIQFLKNHGVANEDILIEGYSLGGGVGAQAAALHPQVNYVNRSSFSSLTQFGENLVYNYIVGGNPKTASCFRKIIAAIVSFILGGILKGVMWAKSWEMDSVAVWDKIKGHKWIITSTNDQIMKGTGAFYKGLKQSKKSALTKAGYKKIVNKQDEQSLDQQTKNDQIKEEMFRHIKARGYLHQTPLKGKLKAKHYQNIRLALHRAANSIS
jgi:hypothetical protein